MMTRWDELDVFAPGGRIQFLPPCDVQYSTCNAHYIQIASEMRASRSKGCRSKLDPELTRTLVTLISLHQKRFLFSSCCSKS